MGLLTGVVLTTLGGFLAAGAGLTVSLHNRRADKRDQVASVIDALHAEISVSAELAVVDLPFENLVSKEGKENLSKISRMRAARTVFEALSNQLGILPESLPSQIVRYYGRLEANGAAMYSCLDGTNIFGTNKGKPSNPALIERYKKARDVIALEADILRVDLDAARPSRFASK